MHTDVLQTVFYVMGIIFMTLSVLILVAIGLLLFYIKKKVFDIAKNIEEKLMAFEVGAQVAHSAVEKVRRMIRKE